MALYSGALEAAEEELASLRKLLDAAHVPGTAAIFFGATEALLLRFRGEPEQAAERLRSLQAEAREAGDLQQLAAIDQSLAEALMELSEEDKAKVVMQEAISLTDRGVYSYGGVPARCIMSVICSHQGAIAEARSLVSEAREKAAGLGDSAWNAAWLLSAEAHLAAAESNWSAAWSAFADTADDRARMGMRWYRARTLQEWAEAHLSRGEPGDRERAGDLLSEAKAEFEAMGAPIYAEQARARLHKVDAG
jgi:3-methyladenine DNA glycosylase/8-oxoguanine DNA glycosylase